MSMLRDMDALGALVRHTVREDGTAVSETLTRLPEAINSNSNPTVLAPTTKYPEETVRIVLNKPQTNSSLSNDAKSSDDCPLPAILERTRSTIPTFMGHNSVFLEHISPEAPNRRLKGRKRLASTNRKPRKKLKPLPT
jgi:hypothetical protein